MKTLKNYIVPFLLVSLVVFNSACSGAKTAIGFKKTLKQVDTFTVIPSIINLQGIGVENEIVKDRQLCHKISDSITSTIYSVLNKKYVINVYPEYNELNEGDLFKLRDVIISLDDAGKTLPPLKIEKNVYQAFNHTGSRYVLFTYLEGMYKTDARIKAERGRRIAMTIGSAAIALATLGTVVLVPKGPSSAIMKTFLYDCQAEVVLMYHSSEVLETSLKDQETIRNFVLGGVKRLYYK